MTYTDEYLRGIFETTKIIAVVGMSSNQNRPSHYVSRFLSEKGFRVIPVNPGLEGQELLGEKVYARVRDIPFDVDMVDIFRRSEAVPEIVDDALAHWPSLKTIWMQIGVQHAEAATKAVTRGVNVVQNRCPKIEYQRLYGEMGLAKFKTDVSSTRF